MTSFKNIYVAELAIRKLIKNDNHSEAFIHCKRGENEEITLDLLTLNPTHENTVFLLHSIEGWNLLELYNQMYQYLYHLKKTLKANDGRLMTYTLTWIDQSTTHVSYFSGKSVEEIMRKFYYGKTTKPTLLKMVLSPKS